MWNIEVTDTFAGEANYCWVKRGTVELKPSLTALSVKRAQHRAVIKAVREVAGWPVSVRVNLEDFGDAFTIRPRGLLQVAFVTWQDEAAS